MTWSSLRVCSHEAKGKKLFRSKDDHKCRPCQSPFPVVCEHVHVVFVHLSFFRGANFHLPEFWVTGPLRTLQRAQERSSALAFFYLSVFSP